MKLKYVNILLLLLIIIILIYYNLLDNTEFYSSQKVTDILKNKDIRYREHICNIYKNLNSNNTNPYFYDINLNNLDITKEKHKIQNSTAADLENNYCNYKQFDNINNFYTNFLICNGDKDCDNLSYKDKVNICTKFNYPIESEQQKCATRGEHSSPLENNVCISNEKTKLLEGLCNGLTTPIQFKNSSNILFKHFYCNDNKNDLNCNEQSSLELLNKLTIRNIPLENEEESCSKHNGGFGIYSTEAVNNIRNNYFGWNNIKLNNTPCTARPNVLARDSIDGNSYKRNIWGNIEEKCTVGDGKWSIPTENRILTNERTIHIDHHVPLKNAYISGACQWNDPNLASVYANDMTPGHLKAISYTMNTSKSDKSPDEWMPYKYRSNKLSTQESISKEDCEYASDWIAIKYRYDLSIRQEEKDELEKVLNSSICQNNNLLYPSYPVYKEDPIGISKIIAKDNKNILLTPILTQKYYNKRIQLKSKWIDWSRNINKTEQERSF